MTSERDPYYIGKCFDQRWWVLQDVGAIGMGMLYRGRDERRGVDVLLLFVESDFEEIERKKLSPARISKDVRQVAGYLPVEETILILDELVVVFPFGGGKPLNLWMDAHGLFPLRTAFRVVFEVAFILLQAEEAGTPMSTLFEESVLLDENNHVSILSTLAWPSRDDFGTFEALTSNVYADPRAYRSNGHTDRVSATAILAQLLTHLITGRHPYPAVTTRQQLEEIISGSPRRPSEVDRTISPVLDEFVLRCLAGPEGVRPDGPADFCLQLDDLLRQVPDESTSDPGLTPEERFVLIQAIRRRKVDEGGLDGPVSSTDLTVSTDSGRWLWLGAAGFFTFLIVAAAMLLLFRGGQ